MKDPKVKKVSRDDPVILKIDNAADLIQEMFNVNKIGLETGMSAMINLMVCFYLESKTQEDWEFLVNEMKTLYFRLKEADESEK